MRWMAIALALLLATVSALHAEESDSPHRMVKADGETDMDKCALCHEPDLSLSRSKRETCTLCHAETLHSGAYEHFHAAPDKLKQLLGTAPAEKPELPTAEDGGIYCGTCHLFHDPAISAEKPLATEWARSSAGLADAIRRAREAQWKEIAQKYGQPGPGAEFATKGTRALRLPIDDGSLCRHCHGYGK